MKQFNKEDMNTGNYSENEASMKSRTSRRNGLLLALCIFLVHSLTCRADNYEVVSIKSFEDGKITLKKKIDSNDFRKNPDGTVFYRTTFAVDLEYNKQTITSIIETDAYTATSMGKAMLPCMLIDIDKKEISIFSNSKAADRYYGMEGFLYRMDMNSKQWKKEVVFTNANFGWFSFFGGSDNGSPELWHFSYAGYYSILSKRNASNNKWSNQKIGSIRPEVAEQQYASHRNILITSYSGVDGMGTGGASNYSSRSQQNSSTTSSSLLNSPTATALAVGGTAAMIYGLCKLLFSGTTSSSESSSSYSYLSGGSSSSSRSSDNGSTSSNAGSICENYDEDNVEIPRITKETEWKAQDYLEYKDIEFADGTKGTIWRWNATNEAPKKYHVPYVIDNDNIVPVNWHYKSDDYAIKALYFYKKCDKNRSKGHFIP